MISKNLTVAVSAIILGALLFITIGWYWYRSTQDVGLVVADDIQKLAHIFDKIDKTAGILGFDYQKNPINFLNIRSFVGSEVGSMNLKYPKKWQGPYLDDNLAAQSKDYLVLKTKKGYYIVPGDGVRLPNGKIMGKDIVLSEDADIEALMNDPEGLLWNGKALAAPLKKKEEGAQAPRLEDQ